MASDNAVHHIHKDYVPVHGHGGKKLGPGRLSKNPQENFLSQNEEREWVDFLLDCSPQNEKLDPIVNCYSWEEVSTGWRQIVPNATYISHVTEKKDAEKEKEKNGGKIKSSQKLISFEKDLSWKHCIEPGTYRYVHRSAYTGVQKKKCFNKGPVKRSMDATLKEHIRKVKEHLEKVLVQQTAPKAHQRPLWAVHNYGDYVSSLIRETKPNRPQLASEVMHSPRCINPSEDQAQQAQTKVPDVGLTYTVKRGSPVQKSQKSSPLPHLPLMPQPENKTSKDLVALLGSKLIDLIQKDNFQNGIKTRHPRNKTQEKLLSSYEKFTVPAPVESPILKPLVKVTPGQRQIHDDNEVIGAVAKMNKRDALQFIDSTCSSIYPISPTPSRESQIVHYQESKETAHGCKFQKLDPANKNFFTYGIAGKAVCLTDVEVRVKNLAGISRILSKNHVEVKKRGTLYPQKNGSNCTGGKGDLGFGVTNRLGDPLHRGVVDRGAAGAIASQLLPGVNGHKIGFPMYQAYRII